MKLKDIPGHAPIVDEETFALIAELEVRKAVRLQYFVSLLSLEAHAGDGSTVLAGTTTTERLARMISTQIRSTDTVGVGGGPATLHLLLINANLYNLILIVDRIQRTLTWHAVEPDQPGEVVVLSIGGACFPTTARGRDDLFAQAELLMREANADPAEPCRYRLASPSR